MQQDGFMKLLNLRTSPPTLYSFKSKQEALDWKKVNIPTDFTKITSVTSYCNDALKCHHKNDHIEWHERDKDGDKEMKLYCVVFP